MLFATDAPWQEIAGDYDLKFATLKTRLPEPKTPDAEQVQARGFFDWVEEVVDKTIDKFKDLRDKFGDSFDSIVKELGEIGDKTFDQSQTWNLDAGTPGERKNIYTDLFK